MWFLEIFVTLEIVGCIMLIIFASTGEDVSSYVITFSDQFLIALVGIIIGKRLDKIIKKLDDKEEKDK